MERKEKKIVFKSHTGTARERSRRVRGTVLADEDVR
jgi:hypothetical protein